MAVTFQFVTDTSAMCAFDLGALRHRLDDDADWWSVPREELAEINAGNVAFINLGADGRYEAAIVEERQPGGVVVRLRCPTGRIFVGSGEEVTGDGVEPEAIRVGGFVEVAPGAWELSITRNGVRITVGITPISSEDAHNAFESLVSI